MTTPPPAAAPAPAAAPDLAPPPATAPSPTPARRTPRPATLAYALAGLPLSLLGIVYVLAVLYVGGLLSLTLIGLPLLAVGLRGARHLGRAHARLIRALLDEPVEAPAIPPAAPGGNRRIRWIRDSLTDTTAWRAVLYLMLRFPLDVLALAATVGLPVAAVWSLVWVLTTHPGPRPAAATLLAALIALTVTPFAARAVLHAHRRLARTLLGPTTAQRRVHTLERARSTALTEGARSLRQVERDLHDGTQAQLVAIAITLSLTADTLDADTLEGEAPPTDRTRALVARARTQTDAAIAELRRLIDGISPAALDLGLADALPRLTSQAGVPVALKVDVAERPDAVIERVAYFCVAELLTNISKHSGATRASVHAQLTAGRLRLRVHDDGVGGARIGAGTGLAGLRERLTAVDGTLTLDSPPAGPTTALIELPAHI
ncbi:sensor domain-containing protein [Streptomyces sp. NPDC048606]|uniref:sensor histidine kinase n=1 Tax=Streptomyces sp. NPDC048606 TaxID=3154726 RepID=UPI00342D35BF